MSLPTHTFRRGVRIATASTAELERQMDYELECLADDLRVCGRDYPSPLRPSIRAIALELTRRKLIDMYPGP